MPVLLRNTPAEGVSFFTPEQNTPLGKALAKENGSIPKLFRPLKIRSIELPNRIWVSPMCQYSAKDGFTTPWHLAHYGSIIQRGPGLTMIEATAAEPRGRITPEDLGIWSDDHIDSLHKLTEFAHSQNGLIAIQIGHAGRKASTVAPWLHAGTPATQEVGGWPTDILAPTGEPYAKGYFAPRAMTLDDIEQVKRAFVAAVQRAVKAGFDVIELHFAHGYLASSFMSPAVNKRIDRYGGSFENRVRLPLEIVELVRAAMPETMPLFVRISATDWLHRNPEYEGENWNIGDSIKLAHLLAERGVDVLDVSSGGIHPLQKVQEGPGYQAGFAKQIKQAVGDKMLVSSVGIIENGTLAEELISGGKGEDDAPLDLIGVGRMFLKNPGLVIAWAEELDTSIELASQIRWAFRGRGANGMPRKKLN